MLVRIPAEYLHTPDTGQGTCIPQILFRVPFIPLTLVRVPAEYLHTPDTGQDTKQEVLYIFST